MTSIGKGCIEVPRGGELRVSEAPRWAEHGPRRHCGKGVTSRRVPGCYSTRGAWARPHGSPIARAREYAPSPTARRPAATPPRCVLAHWQCAVACGTPPPSPLLAIGRGCRGPGPSTCTPLFRVTNGPSFASSVCCDVPFGSRMAAAPRVRPHLFEIDVGSH